MIGGDVEREVMGRPEVGTSRRPDWPLAVIVGAGGMGMAIARRLGQSHRLLIADRDESQLDRQSAMLAGEGHDVATFRCDVTNADDVHALAACAGANGPVTALANVVGLSPSMGDFRAIIGVNIVGATRVAEGFLPIMASGGCALFISSIAAHTQPLDPEVEALLDSPLRADLLSKLEVALGDRVSSHLAYIISKASLNRMRKRRALDWGRRGLRLVSLSPGLIATPMGALEFERTPMKYDLLAVTPIKREGTMLEIANVVEFLLSDKASFISGTDIIVDGGLVGTLHHGEKPTPD